MFKGVRRAFTPGGLVKAKTETVKEKRAPAKSVSGKEVVRMDMPLHGIRRLLGKLPLGELFFGKAHTTEFAERAVENATVQGWIGGQHTKKAKEEIKAGIAQHMMTNRVLTQEDVVKIATSKPLPTPPTPGAGLPKGDKVGSQPRSYFEGQKAKLAGQPSTEATRKLDSLYDQVLARIQHGDPIPLDIVAPALAKDIVAAEKALGLREE